MGEVKNNVETQEAGDLSAEEVQLANELKRNPDAMQETENEAKDLVFKQKQKEVENAFSKVDGSLTSKTIYAEDGSYIDYEEIKDGRKLLKKKYSSEWELELSMTINFNEEGVRVSEKTLTIDENQNEITDVRFLDKNWLVKKTVHMEEDIDDMNSRLVKEFDETGSLTKDTRVFSDLKWNVTRVENYWSDNLESSIDYEYDEKSMKILNAIRTVFNPDGSYSEKIFDVSKPKSMTVKKYDNEKNLISEETNELTKPTKEIYALWVQMKEYEDSDKTVTTFFEGSSGNLVNYNFDVDPNFFTEESEISIDKWYGSTPRWTTITEYNLDPTRKWNEKIIKEDWSWTVETIKGLDSNFIRITKPNGDVTTYEDIDKNWKFDLGEDGKKITEGPDGKLITVEWNEKIIKSAEWKIIVYRDDNNDKKFDRSDVVKEVEVDGTVTLHDGEDFKKKITEPDWTITTISYPDDDWIIRKKVELANWDTLMYRRHKVKTWVWIKENSLRDKTGKALDKVFNRDR